MDLALASIAVQLDLHFVMLVYVDKSSTQLHTSIPDFQELSVPDWSTGLQPWDQGSLVVQPVCNFFPGLVLGTGSARDGTDWAGLRRYSLIVPPVLQCHTHTVVAAVEDMDVDIVAGGFVVLVGGS